jgi:2'-5' RNA ligase
MPRLFTGLEIPADIAFDLDLMRGGIVGARWLDRENYHLTLRFIGDIENGLGREIVDELQGVEAAPFKLQLKGVDVLGGNKPHTLYAGVAVNPELLRLQTMHERICQSLGLAPDKRKFSPHVTLARLQGTPLDNLHRFIAAHSLYRSREFEVARFVLFSSRPQRGGGPYAVEGSYALQAAV